MKDYLFAHNIPHAYKRCINPIETIPHTSAFIVDNDEDPVNCTEYGIHSGAFHCKNAQFFIIMKNKFIADTFKLIFLNKYIEYNKVNINCHSLEINNED